MNRTINALPPFWAAVAYALLALGIVFVFGFLSRYMVKCPWYSSEEGRHLVAMSANVGAFFLLYTALAVWPDFPGRNTVRFVLFILLVANCGWRWWMLERYLRKPTTALNQIDSVTAKRLIDLGWTPPPATAVS